MKILNLTMLALGFLLLNAASCAKEDGDTLPPETQEGKNTFGCLVNGKVWLKGDSGFMNHSLSASMYGDSCVIYANNTADVKIQHLKLIINRKINTAKYYINSRTYSLLEHNESSCNCIFRSDSLYNQESSNISITYIDTTNRILSGTFAFKAKLKETLPLTCDCDTSDINITNGRFDLHYFKY
jgi:hypothetical protein